MLCLSRNSIVCSCTILSSTFDIRGRREIGRQFLGSVLESFLKSGLNYTILQTSGNLLEEIDRLHSCVIGVANNDAPSFRKIPERSSKPGALLSSKSKCFSFFLYIYIYYIYIYMNIFINIQLQHKKSTITRHYLFGMSRSKIKKQER